MMQVEDNRPQRRGALGKLLPLSLMMGIGLAAALGIVHAPYAVMLVLLGLPTLLLMVTKRTRVVGVLIILALAPFLGIVKTFTGSRYAPLVLDAALLLLLTVLLLDGVVLSRFRLRVSSLMAMVVLFIALAAAQMFNPNIPGILTGLEGFRPYCQAAGFFVGVWLIESRRQVKQVVVALSCSSFLVAAYGVKQFFYPSWVDLTLIDMTTASPITYSALGQMRAFSTMSGPFHLGIYMVMVILLMVVLFQHKGRRPAVLVAAVVYLVTLLLTLTRSSWVGLLGALAFYVALLALQRRSKLTFRATATVCLLLGGVVLFVQSQPDLSAMSDYFTSLGAITQAPHFQGRITGWREWTLPAILSQPLIGYGTGSALDTFSHRSVPLTRFTSHSLYVKYALEMGLAGLVMFLMIVVPSMRRGVKIYLELKDAYLKSIAAWILTFIVAVCISGLSGPILDAYPVNLYFWMMLGLLLNLKNIEDGSVESCGARTGACSAVASRRGGRVAGAQAARGASVAP